MFIRLSAADREELLADFDEAALFEPVAGRVMKEYAVMPESILNDRLALKTWLDRSYDFVSSLPFKEPKPRKR